MQAEQMQLSDNTHGGGSIVSVEEDSAADGSRADWVEIGSGRSVAGAVLTQSAAVAFEAVEDGRLFAGAQRTVDRVGVWPQRDSGTAHCRLVAAHSALPLLLLRTTHSFMRSTA